MSISVGLKGTASTQVTDLNTAQTLGSGTLPVFATPAMAALMEQAAYTSLFPELEQGQGSVGTELSIRHLSATPVGMTVRAESTVIKVDGRTITFEVNAFDDAGLIGSGTHQRVIINDERFLTKAQAKREVKD